MAKNFLDLIGLGVFKDKIKEMIDSRINENMKIEVYNDYWVMISQDGDTSNTNSTD